MIECMFFMCNILTYIYIYIHTFAYICIYTYICESYFSVHCVAMCCSVLKCMEMPQMYLRIVCFLFQCVAMCCSMLQCDAVPQKYL